MECSSENPLLVRRGPRTVAAVTVLLLLAWITAACMFMKVEHEFSGHRIQGGRRIAYVFLPGQWALPTRDLQLEVLEDGQEMGPRAPARQDLLGTSKGGYALRSRGWPRTSVLYLSPADGSDPRQNGRRYVVRYPRRQLPASLALLLGSWIILPLVAFRYSRRSADSPLREWASLRTAAWSVVVIGSLYTLFAAQAWLPPLNIAWFLAIVAVAFPLFLRSLIGRELHLPAWSPWIAGLLAWIACSLFGVSPYASPATASTFVAASAGGLVVYFGIGGALDRYKQHCSSLLLGLFVFAAGLSLARNAGFDLAGSLASVGLSSVWPARVVNPWTTKFIGHWLLVVLWCCLAAIGWNRRDRVRPTLMLSILAIVVIGLNGSPAAIMALLVSVAVAVVALRWPKVVRGVVVYGLVSVTVVAPLLAGVSWRVQSELSGHVSEGARDALDLDRRGGKWEFSRRFIELRPFQGWGFGASSGLPGRGLPIHDALGLDPGAKAPPSSYPALAGGHPHNAALLTWLDLGFVGALLVAGFLAAIGRSIAALEEQRRVHSAVLGLFSVTAVYLLFNYPVWDPEVASILWMSAALAATVLPRPAVSRRQLLRSGAAVLLVLSFGCAVLAQARLSRWLTVRDLRESDVVLDPAARRLTVGDEAEVLRYDGSLDAGAKLIEGGPGTAAVIRGWAFGPPGTQAPEGVLVFVGSDLVGVVWPERPSPELFERAEPKDIRALTAGFEVQVEPDRVDLRAPVTVVALRPGYSAASELPPLSTESP